VRCPDTMGRVGRCVTLTQAALVRNARWAHDVSCAKLRSSSGQARHPRRRLFACRTPDTLISKYLSASGEVRIDCPQIRYDVLLRRVQKCKAIHDFMYST